MEDAFSWCQTHLGTEVPGTKVDTYAVGGDSAGGALACLAGHILQPRRRAILNLYGLVDATEPSFHVASGRKATSGAFNREEIEAAIADRDPANAVTICPWEWEMEPILALQELQRYWGMPGFEVTREHRLRADINAVLGSEGRLIDTLLRRDTLTEEEYERALVDMSAAKRPLDKSYPATFFLHGEADVVVPASQSRDMAAKLRGVGVPTGEVYDPTGGHCFDVEIEVSAIAGEEADEQGPDDAGWEVYVTPAVGFICAHVERRA